jgi:hypothetical protein
MRWLTECLTNTDIFCRPMDWTPILHVSWKYFTSLLPLVAWLMGLHPQHSRYGVPSDKDARLAGYCSHLPLTRYSICETRNYTDFILGICGEILPLRRPMKSQSSSLTPQIAICLIPLFPLTNRRLETNRDKLKALPLRQWSTTHDAMLSPYAQDVRILVVDFTPHICVH